MAYEIYDVECTREKGKAILVEIEGEDFWVPRSQITEDSEVYKSGTEGTLIITDWLAARLGLAD